MWLLGLGGGGGSSTSLPPAPRLATSPRLAGRLRLNRVAAGGWWPPGSQWVRGTSEQAAHFTHGGARARPLLRPVALASPAGAQWLLLLGGRWERRATRTGALRGGAASEGRVRRLAAVPPASQGNSQSEGRGVPRGARRAGAERSGLGWAELSWAEERRRDEAEGAVGAGAAAGAGPDRPAGAGRGGGGGRRRRG